VLAYYGSAKERALRRQGWGRPNAFHVCITTYNVVLQDASVFRRKQWQYLILDEAHNIRNFRSKRWQVRNVVSVTVCVCKHVIKVLLTLKTKRRLLLTGTPLQNSLMELWSLLHLLMPHVFASHSEFKVEQENKRLHFSFIKMSNTYKEWFASPMDTMIEEKQVDSALVHRLHTILQPFLLRRKKNEVERQLPEKKEHVQLCRLSKRQRGLYEEFLATRRKTLQHGNVMGVMNILMQLRK
jgi:SNF2 family DNA or RNA helicase